MSEILSYGEDENNPPRKSMEGRLVREDSSSTGIIIHSSHIRGY